MAFDSATSARHDGGWGTIAALAAADGSATHSMPALLGQRSVVVRDYADAVHALCALHGAHPGVIDLAVSHKAQPRAADWLAGAAEHFAIERSYLARLTAAVGPLPSTPGQAESEAAVIAQRRALEMLARSDRAGCATGAAIALVLDWAAIRHVLDTAAHRFGITPPTSELPLGTDIATVAAGFAETPGVERAMAFGAQQLLAQHRGLWDLLEARASARVTVARL